MKMYMKRNPRKNHPSQQKHKTKESELRQVRSKVILKRLTGTAQNTEERAQKVPASSGI